MALTLNQVLGGIPMTAAAQVTTRGIPNALPPVFLNVSQRVQGNLVQYNKITGGRKLARFAQYGSPSRLAGKTGITRTPAVLLHAFDHQSHDPTVLQNLQSADGTLQDLAVEQVERQTDDFMETFNSTRVASVYSALANGKIWYDSEGNILPNSTGNAGVVDFYVPAGNQNQVGGIIDASWALAGTDIIGHIKKLKKKSLKDTGYPLVHAFYGEDVAKNIANNTSVSAYLKANPAYAQAIYETGEIPAGFLGLQWHPVEAAFAPNAAGVMTDFWGADTVTFTPEVTPDWYEFVEGSYLVPQRIDVVETALAAMNNFKTVFGKFSYATPTHDPAGVKHYAGDTMLPLIKVGGAIFIVDTTP